jgi:signal transduction histidine kinase
MPDMRAMPPASARVEGIMTNLTLISSRQPAASLLSVQWAHDVRNLLATIGLHLDTLERLSGPRGARAANAARGLLGRLGGMCKGAGAECRRRQPFDIAATLGHVIDFVAPLGPDGFTVNLKAEEPILVLADHDDVFRILFNLVHNAVTVARAGRTLRRLDILVSRTDEIAEVRIADDGLGLPPEVKARLFRGSETVDAAHGHGLAIARELAERNGGTLTCRSSRKGTVFRLELAAFTSIRIAEGPVTRSLGRRASN